MITKHSILCATLCITLAGISAQGSNLSHTVQTPNSPEQQKLVDNALFKAAEKGDFQEVNRLIYECKANVNVRGSDFYNDTALHKACSRGHLEVVKVLLMAGAQVDAQNFLAKTPLHLACKNGRLEIANLLIEAGADVNKKDDDFDKNTPLCITCEKGYTELVKTLIKAGAKVNERGYVDSSPLDWTSIKNYPEMAKILIKAGASLNETSNRWSSLHYACAHGNLEVAKILIKAGAAACLNKTTPGGETPLNLLCKEKRSQFLQTLVPFEKTRGNTDPILKLVATLFELGYPDKTFLPDKTFVPANILIELKKRHNSFVPELVYLILRYKEMYLKSRILPITPEQVKLCQKLGIKKLDTNDELILTKNLKDLAKHHTFSKKQFHDLKIFSKDQNIEYESDVKSQVKPSVTLQEIEF